MILFEIKLISIYHAHSTAKHGRFRCCCIILNEIKINVNSGVICIVNHSIDVNIAKCTHLIHPWLHRTVESQTHQREWTEKRVGNTWEIVVELRGRAKYFWHLSQRDDEDQQLNPFHMFYPKANSCQLCWSWKSPLHSPCHWANGSCCRLSFTIHKCESLHRTSTHSNTEVGIKKSFSTIVNRWITMNKGAKGTNTRQLRMSTNFVACEHHPLQNTVVWMD